MSRNVFGRHITRSNIGRGPQRWWILGLLALLFAAPAYSQGLGEIARQERERKMNQPHTATHVYENEDLERPQILVREDREGVQARKPVSPPAPETAGDERKVAEMPLGDVARHYRALKAERQKTAPQGLPPGSHGFTMPIIPELGSLSFPYPDARIAEPVSPSGTPEVVGDERKVAEMPLGDVARYYRALKAERRKTARQGLPPGSHGFMPIIPGLADPSFPEPDSHIAPPPVRTHTSADLSLKAPRGLEISGGVHVRVRPGDTLWQLARKYLGRGKDWMLVAAINPQVSDPIHLRVGTLLLLPDGAELASARTKRSLLTR